MLLLLCLQSSPQRSVTEIRDLILKPPGKNPYIIKEQLTERTTASEQRRLQQLFSTEELGDRKPTQLLRQLQQLADDTPVLTEGIFIRKLLLQRLPANFRMVLASTRKNTSIEELAHLADRIMKVAVPPLVSNVSHNYQNWTNFKQRSQASHK